jgi:hypothetical protein
VGRSHCREDRSVVYNCWGPRQHSHFRVRDPWDSWPYFTSSDSRLPFSSPPTTRRVTVEVFDPTSTRESAWSGPYNNLPRTVQESRPWRVLLCCSDLRGVGNACNIVVTACWTPCDEWLLQSNCVTYEMCFATHCLANGPMRHNRFFFLPNISENVSFVCYYQLEQKTAETVIGVVMVLVPIAVAFAHSNTGIVGSNPTRGMDVVCAFILCIGRGLPAGWFHIQGVLPTVYRIMKLKSGQGPTKGCKAIDSGVSGSPS